MRRWHKNVGPRVAQALRKARLAKNDQGLRERVWLMSILVALSGAIARTIYEEAAKDYIARKLFDTAESLIPAGARADTLCYSCTVANASFAQALAGFEVRIALEAPTSDQSYRLLTRGVWSTPGVDVGERFINSQEPRVETRQGVTLKKPGDNIRFDYWVVGSNLSSVRVACDVDRDHSAGLDPAVAHPPPPGFDIYSRIPWWATWVFAMAFAAFIALAAVVTVLSFARLVRRTRES